MEPTLIKSKSTTEPPITPVAKIVSGKLPNQQFSKPHQKLLNDSLLETDKEKLSSKFYIKSVNFEDELNHSKSMIPVAINAETPTRKRSKSQEQKEKLLKKVKSIDIPSTPETYNQFTTSTVLKPVKPPMKFQPINNTLIDSSKVEIDQLKDIFNSNVELDPNLKMIYTETSQLSSNDWIFKGFQNVNKNYDLVKKIIVIRFELSIKFDKIFNMINKYGEHLEKNDEELNNKMQRLQKLGEEIKNFIK